MKESVLHIIWESNSLSDLPLKSISGKQIKIIHPGYLNSDSGPDFFKAKIQIDNLEWNGNIEMHINSSDWLKHGHSNDKNYSKLLLHVVYRNDIELNLEFPTLELCKYFTENEIEDLAYGLIQFRDKKLLIGNDIECESLVLQRLKRKSAEVEILLKETKNDWEEVFYRLLARNMGFHTNSFPFDWLSRSTPLAAFRKHSNNLQDVEAILFGQSGILMEFRDNGKYETDLWSRYERIKRKNNLHFVSGHIWKFMRMRPSNFPTLRLAQLAAVLYWNKVSLVSPVFNINHIRDALKIFSIPASMFWNNHYSFKTISPPSEKKLGKTSVQNIMINTVVPFKYTYEKKHGKKLYAENSLSLLSQISPEINRHTALWQSSGVEIQNALVSQALLEMRTSDNIKMFNFETQKYSH